MQISVIMFKLRVYEQYPVTHEPIVAVLPISNSTRTFWMVQMISQGPRNKEIKT